MVVRQDLVMDASSEQNFWPRNDRVHLRWREHTSQEQVGLSGGLQMVVLWPGRSWVWGSVRSEWNWNSSSPLFSTLSSPDIPFSFLSYFPSLPQAEFTALYGDGALEEARRLREGNWASVRTVLTGAVALGALVTVGAFFASK